MRVPGDLTTDEWVTLRALARGPADPAAVGAGTGTGAPTAAVVLTRLAHLGLARRDGEEYEATRLGWEWLDRH